VKYGVLQGVLAVVELSPVLLRSFNGQHWMIDRGDCAAISGMNEW
jgi:hypothetical protein